MYLVQSFLLVICKQGAGETVVKALTLHMDSPSLIPGIRYGPLSLTSSDP